jgi:hypothetical protein
MAKKDFEMHQNTDLVGEPKEHPVPPGLDEKEQPAEAEKKQGGTEIKNAHATGDGSFGRSDDSLSDKDGQPADDTSKY